LEGKRAVGKKEIEKFKRGEKLTYKQAVLAKCYDCCCGYADGKVDCKVENCPHYIYMPFRVPTKN